MKWVFLLLCFKDCFLLKKTVGLGRPSLTVSGVHQDRMQLVTGIHPAFQILMGCPKTRNILLAITVRTC